MNNENAWTQGGKHHTLGLVRGPGARGGITLGEIPNVDDRLMDAAYHYGTCILCNKPAYPAHVQINKVKFKKRKKIHYKTPFFKTAMNK